MSNDASSTSESNGPAFRARLDAVFAQWDAQIRKELPAAYARRRRRRGTDVPPPLEVLKVELHNFELEIANSRDEIARASSAAADWENKAMCALNENEEGFARQALIQCQEYREALTELSLDVEILEATATELCRLLAHFERRDVPSFP